MNSAYRRQHSDTVSVIQRNRKHCHTLKANLANELPQDLKGNKVQLLLQVPFDRL